MNILGRGILVLVALAVGGLLLGCVGVASPAPGAIWMDVKGPLDAGERVGRKQGVACAKSYAGMVAMGDASIATAAANGGITKIESVDHHSKNMVIIGEFCTIVRGS